MFIGETKNAENVAKKAEEASSKKTTTQKPSSSSSSSTSTSSSSSKDSGFQWTFKIFGDSSRGGKSFEGGDKDKTFIILGALGVAGVLAYVLSQDYNQREITWREFTYK